MTETTSSRGPASLEAARVRVAWDHMRFGLIVAAHVFLAILGVHAAFVEQGEVLRWLMIIAVDFCLTLACVFDAKLRGRPLLPIVQLIILLTWPIGVAGYLLVRRRWRGAVWLIVFVVSLTLAWAVPHLLMLVVRAAA